MDFPRYEVGMLVNHPKKPEWGPGKVLAVGGDIVTVYFRDLSEQNPGDAIRKIKVSIVPLTPRENQSDPWLDNLPPWDLKKKKPAERRWTQEEALKNFLKKYPGGFNDELYLEEERNYKWAAHEHFAKQLGDGQYEQLLVDHNFLELAKRALSVVSKVNLLSPYENAALRDALHDEMSGKRFFETLLGVLNSEAPRQSDFEPYAEAVKDLPAEEGRARVATWPNLTIIPYLARPESYIFLKPEVTKQAAERLAFELHYRSDLNWKTYERLILLGELLMKDLSPHGARDLLDVQSFIWVTGTLEQL